MIAPLLTWAVLSTPMAVADRTTFVRQFAKDAPTVYIVYATPGALEPATGLRRMILNHKDLNSKKRIEIVTPDEASVLALQDRKFDDSVVITLFAEPKEFLPQRMQEYVALAPQELKGATSRIRSIRTRDADKGLAFKISLYAPDKERLQRLLDEFSGLSYDHWKDMKVDTSFRSYKLIRYGSAETLDIRNGWGSTRDEWTYLESKALVDYSPATIDTNPEFDRCVMIDRSQRQHLPDSLERDFGVSLLKPTEQVVKKRQMPNGRWIAVLCAPDMDHLVRIARRFNSIESIPTDGYRGELADLSGVRDAAVVLYGRDSSLTLEKLRSQVESKIQGVTGKSIVSIGDSAEAIKGIILGQTSGQGLAQSIRKAKLRFVWAMDVTSVSRRTSYRSNQSRLTSDPGTPSAPIRPSRSTYPKGVKGDVQYAQAMETYRVQIVVYERQIDDYRYRTPVQWSQTLTRNQDAGCNLTLTLYELVGNQLKVVWSANGSGSASSSSNEGSNTVTTYGHASAGPQPLSTPPSEDRCDYELVDEAVVEGLDACLDRLLDTCLLKGGPGNGTLTGGSGAEPGPGMKGSTSGRGTPLPPIGPVLVDPPRTGKSIAALSKGKIVVDIGRNMKVRKGDKMLAVFKWHLVKGTIKPYEYIAFKVVAVSARSSSCQIIDKKDLSRFNRLHIGQPVAWLKKDA